MMENGILANLEPKSVLRFFEELCRIPHGSGNTAAASDWAEKFARDRNLRHRRDQLGNVVIWKEASPGYEDHPVVMLQGHLDMVCVQENGLGHDFTRDPLDLYVDGDWIKARGTSLGSDDGIAVAMAMAVLDDDTIPHPPLEAVFTVDEEVGMPGAMALDGSDLKSRYLLNIDSELEGVLTVGCAGGARCDVTRAFPVQETSGIRYTVRILGGQGGHSGTAIHMGFANANKLLGQCLAGLEGIQLVSLHGGEQDNAIPKEAEAVFFSNDLAAPELPEEVWAAYAEKEPDLELEVSGEMDEKGTALSPEDTQTVLNLLRDAPNGILAMNPDLPGQVQTSLNLGVLRLEEGQARLTFCIRSSVAAEKSKMAEDLRALAAANGGEYAQHGDYPPWEYRKESALRDVMVRVFRQQYGKDPVVETVHAGLECGILMEKVPGLDAVSLGPDLIEIHSTRERMSIASLQRTWAYLLAVLKEL